MIETARLRLRPWRPDDQAEFARVLNTAAVTAHLGGVANEAALAALFERRLIDQQLHGCCYWAAELRETGELIGSCGLRIARDYPDTPVAGMVEAGWRLGESHWRKGYAEEAMRAALEWGWQVLDPEFIATWTIAENAASLALMKRLGFARAESLDFVRAVSGEPCLVHIIANPSRTGTS